MPDIYFNNEVGPASDLAIGSACIVRAAHAYKKMADRVAEALTDRTFSGLSNYIFVRDSDLAIDYNIESVLPTLSVADKTCVILLLAKFGSGRKVEMPINFTPSKLLSCPAINTVSPFLEFALERQGMALTIATEADWEVDFIEFDSSVEKLPNIWNDASSSCALDYWHESYASKVQLLEYKFPEVCICSAPALRDSDFNANEWEDVFGHFSRARERKYAPDNNLICVLKGVHNISEASVLVELRIQSIASRIFFVCHNDSVLIGGTYRKGNGPNDRKLQSAAAQRSLARIRNFINNSI